MADLKSLDNTVSRDSAVAAFWREFCAHSGVDPGTAYQAWYFGGDENLSHELVELVIHGPKRATAYLAWGVETYAGTAPVLGGYSVVTEFDGTPRAVIRTIWLDTRPFNTVDAQFAWDEGEGDRTLADWMDGHRRYFTRECAQLGRAFTEDAPVILERFELLFPLQQ